MTLCIHELFEGQADRTPDAIAVTCQDKALTYRELNCCANHLAQALRNHGVGPEVLVGLYLERSLEMIVALLGVLKAGGAYVPMDTSYPQARLELMLKDAKPRVLITQNAMHKSLPEHRVPTLCLDLSAPPAARDFENPANKNLPDDLAYIIYTSGSTGSPKGVMITHRNVVRLFRATQPWFRFGSADVWTLFHSYAFDFSVWEIWGALLHGGKLAIVPYWVSRSPEAFWELLQQEGVTVLNQTPSAFRQLVQAEQATETPASGALRVVILGGETLQTRTLQPWFARHGDRLPEIVNMYGITETTVHVTYRRITQADVGAGSVIGVPLPDLQVHLLDPNQRPVSVGVPGEIHVGGSGLARGYLNRPELTKAKFIPNPFNPNPESRLYKSGDLARTLSNGDVEYLGRIDEQVKIRGFRVEPGEIESALLEHPSVNECVVMARGVGSGEQRLVAYITSRQEPPPSTSELQDFLREKLPDYMLPSAFLVLDRIPLTHNGKVNRSALPEVDGKRPNLRTDYLMPQSELECTLAGIWQQVLHVKGIGVMDTFFDLGGESLQLVSVHERLQNVLQTKLPITTLFQFPTIRSLAEHLSEATSQADLRATILDRTRRRNRVFAHNAKVRT